MFFRNAKQLEGLKGASKDVVVNDDLVEKEESSPYNDAIHDHVVHDANENLKNPKKSSPKSCTPPLSFS